MRRLYYKIIRDLTAVRILVALVGSSERYKYIDEKIQSGELDNHTATKKNVNKAIVMADQLVEELQKRK